MTTSLSKVIQNLRTQVQLPQWPHLGIRTSLFRGSTRPVGCPCRSWQTQCFMTRTKSSALSYAVQGSKPEIARWKLLDSLFKRQSSFQAKHWTRPNRSTYHPPRRAFIKSVMLLLHHNHIWPIFIILKTKSHPCSTSVQMPSQMFLQVHESYDRTTSRNSTYFWCNSR